MHYILYNQTVSRVKSTVYNLTQHAVNIGFYLYDQQVVTRHQCRH